MLFHVNLPPQNTTITFQIYEKTFILSAADFISEATLNFEKLVRKWQLGETFSGRTLLSKTRKTIEEALNFDFKNLNKKKKEKLNQMKAKSKMRKQNKGGLASGEKVEIMHKMMKNKDM